MAGCTGPAVASPGLYLQRFPLPPRRAFGSNRLPGLPRHAYQAELRFDHASGLYAALNTEYASRIAVDYANSYWADSHVIFGSRIGYDAPPWPLAAWVEMRNIGNRHYAATVTPGYDDAGRMSRARPGRRSWRLCGHALALTIAAGGAGCDPAPPFQCQPIRQAGRRSLRFQMEGAKPISTSAANHFGEVLSSVEVSEPSAGRPFPATGCSPGRRRCQPTTATPHRHPPAAGPACGRSSAARVPHSRDAAVSRPTTSSDTSATRPISTLVPMRS